MINENIMEEMSLLKVQTVRISTRCKHNRENGKGKVFLAQALKSTVETQCVWRVTFTLKSSKISVRRRLRERSDWGGKKGAQEIWVP